MEDARKKVVGRIPVSRGAHMIALATKAKEHINAAIYDVVDARPPKVIARACDITERNVRALKYREHEPSADTQIRFGFAYPSVAETIAYWAQRMTQPDFFEPETQRQFHRDYQRAGREL
jgi:hypothetical protein